MIVCIRTDTDQAEIYAYSGEQILGEVKWLAGRALAETLLSQVSKLLNQAKSSLDEVSGIVVFAGPGSFTGLRIGVCMANTFAYALGVPIVGTTGDDWQKEGRKLLTTAQNNKFVLPNYGSAPHIST